MVCNQCGGKIKETNDTLTCTKCGRTKEKQAIEENDKIIDMDDNTKNLNILTEA